MNASFSAWTIVGTKDIIVSAGIFVDDSELLRGAVLETGLGSSVDLIILGFLGRSFTFTTFTVRASMEQSAGSDKIY